MALSKFFLPYMQKMLKPFRAINKQIHRATGKIFPGGGIPKKPAKAKEGANFRQIGKSPQDKSGFKVQHLGDNKK